MLYIVEEFKGTPKELEDYINLKAANGIVLFQAIYIASSYLLIFTKWK